MTKKEKEKKKKKRVDLTKGPLKDKMIKGSEDRVVAKSG